MISLIFSIAISHGIDPKLFHAILITESSLRQEVVSNTGDIGMGQISPKLAISKGWDLNRLYTDLRYNLECSAMHLEELKRLYGKQEPKIYWTRYHSYNPVLRFRYKLRVSRYLP